MPPKRHSRRRFGRSGAERNHIQVVFAAITEQDLADMGFVVGQKILLQRVISHLHQDNIEDPPSRKPLRSEAPDPVPGFDLQQELSNKDNAKDNDVVKPISASSSGTTDTTSPPESKPLLPSDFIYGADGKQLKPLQLSYAQFVDANFIRINAPFLRSLNARTHAEAPNDGVLLSVLKSCYQPHTLSLRPLNFFLTA